MRKYYFILPIILLLAACEPDEVCRQETSVTAGIVLRGIVVDTTWIGKEVTTWDTITVQGVGNDSILYDHSTYLSVLRLPLRVDTDVTQFTLLWNGFTDTLFIQHDNRMQFISMACGCVIFHHIDSAWCTRHWMDSVTIINSTIENYEQDNLRVHSTVPDTTWFK